MEDKTKKNKEVIDIIKILKSKTHLNKKLRMQKYIVLGLIEDWYEMPIEDQWKELNNELTKYNEIDRLVNFLNKQV